jgi:hypothetical protein
MPTCRECETNAAESAGRWVIFNEKDNGFDWIFMCIQCVRDWRRRGLEREGNSSGTIQESLDREYPL